MTDRETMLKNNSQWAEEVDAAIERMKRPDNFGRDLPVLLMLDEQSQWHVVGQLATHFQKVGQRHLEVARGLSKLF